MSYDVRLVDRATDECLEVSTHHMKGGTYQYGGSTRAWLHVTSNYRGLLCQVLGDKGIRAIYDMTGAESTPVLKGAIAQLESAFESTDFDASADYWKPTTLNVFVALSQLLEMANMCPEGVWKGD